MKSLLCSLSIVVIALLSFSVHAQPVTLADVDRLLDFAEETEPGIFNPPATTSQLNDVEGSDWFLRTYTGTDVLAAVNINGTGPFFAGDVYLLGGPFGPDPFLAGTLAALLAFIDSVEADDDNDGVVNVADLCPGTAPGVPVDIDGCSAAQLGIVVALEDANKLFNAAQLLDPVAFGPPTTTQVVNQQGSDWYIRTYTNSDISIKININGFGAPAAGDVYVTGGTYGSTNVFVDTLANLLAFIDSLGPLDNDEDGVSNDLDLCPDTPIGQSVNAQGCSNSQLDDDNDGVNNAMDLCPATPNGEAVNADGCSASQLGNNDDDNDGVNNGVDQCPATPSGEPVNAQGCSDTQLDDDNDGVNNALDQCPGTQAGQPVDAQGCSNSQADDDNDGVGNVFDQCPDTPAGQSVNALGCSDTQLDDDLDGVNNALDQCPGTPGGQAVNAQGCSDSQLDDDNDGVNNALDQCPGTPNGEAVDAQGCSDSQNNGGDPVYVVNPGTGSCQAIVLPAEGTVAEYRAFVSSEEGDFSFDYTEEWLTVTQNQVVTRTTQTLVLPPTSTETVTVVTQNMIVDGGLLFLDESEQVITTTTTLIGVPLPPTVSVMNTSITPDPMLFLGPVDQYCEGMILYFPSVTQTILNDPDPFGTNPIMVLTEESTLTVISVAEEVTVTAGTFTTIHHRTVVEGGSVDTWTDIATGMLVKSEIRDDQNEISESTELLSLN